MVLRRVTIKDIADACGLSRNTVSKVFNDRGAVQEKTRQMVLKKAEELGYFQVRREEQASAVVPQQNIALLTSHMPTDHHFGTLFIPAFAGQISRAGYTLRMFELSEEDLNRGRLSSHINLDQTAGLVVIEMFDKSSVEKICALGLPVIFVDDCNGAFTSLLQYDRISMENLSSTIALMEHLLAKGARRIGFVGDPEHCNSFHERWFGFRAALAGAGLPMDKALCILDKDGSPYGDPAWLAEKLRRMPQLPDALFCVNDYIAIRMMAALKQMGIAVPQQVMVCGFDGTAQAAVVDPSLTTAQIPGAEIGRIAADMLLNRLYNPNRPFMSVYVKTVPVWRESTNRR